MIRILLLLITAFATGALILAGEPESTASVPPGSVAPIEASSAGLDLVLEPVAVVPTGPEVEVDSRAAADAYPVWLWTISTSGEPVGEIETREVSDGIMTLGGWAGDINLGLRMSDVLLVACNRVVATVPVDRERADIARRHPNLPAAGWVARLAVSDLVPCERPTITAYATAMFGSAAFALKGEISPEERAAISTENHRLVRHRAEMRSPRSAQAPVRDVDIGDSGVALRRCGQRDCAVIARLPAGRQRLLILDDQAGWFLVAQSGGTAGWAPESALRTIGN